MSCSVVLESWLSSEVLVFAGHLGCSLAWLSSCVTDHSAPVCTLLSAYYVFLFLCCSLAAWVGASLLLSDCASAPVAIETFALSAGCACVAGRLPSQFSPTFSRDWRLCECSWSLLSQCSLELTLPPTCHHAASWKLPPGQGSVVPGQCLLRGCA